jgi:hypothetical protein
MMKKMQPQLMKKFGFYLLFLGLSLIALYIFSMLLVPGFSRFWDMYLGTAGFIVSGTLVAVGAALAVQGEGKQASDPTEPSTRIVRGVLFGIGAIIAIVIGVILLVLAFLASAFPH